MQANDYTKLRPFTIQEVANGAKLCDNLGREIASYDAAHEMIAQNGLTSLRLLPLFWLEGLPVYADSPLEVSHYGSWVPVRGDVVDDRLGGTLWSARWPKPKEQSILEIYVDGERVAQETIPKGTRILYNLEWTEDGL